MFLVTKAPFLVESTRNSHIILIRLLRKKPHTLLVKLNNGLKLRY